MNIHLIIKQLPLLKNNHVKAVVSAIAAKAVPVVVLLAMSPVNATPHEALAQLSEKNSVTMYSQLPQIEAPNALEVAQNPKKPKINPPPRKANGELLAPKVSDPERYINSEKFRGLDGKNYYLIYNNAGESFDQTQPSLPKDEVHYIYIVPEDYEASPRYRRSFPPRVVALVNHNDKYIGARLISRPTNEVENTSEMHLPDNIADKILDIVTNNYWYKYNGDCEFIKTTSMEMKLIWDKFNPGIW